MLNTSQVSRDGDCTKGRVRFVFENTRVDEHGNSQEMRIVEYYHVDHGHTEEGLAYADPWTVPFALRESQRIVAVAAFA